MFSLKQSVKAKIEETSGASIVIALAFFLICALIGSMVLTTASINAQTTVDYKESRQSEYSVSSAAQLIGTELQKDIALSWNWAAVNPDNKPVISINAERGSFAEQLWSDRRDDLWEYNGTLSTWRLNDLEIESIEVSGIRSAEPIYATIVLDQDFNIKAYLSLDASLNAELSPYNEVVELQSITTYDNLGHLIGVSWEEPIITKTSTGAGVP